MDLTIKMDYGNLELRGRLEKIYVDGEKASLGSKSVRMKYGGRERWPLLRCCTSKLTFVLENACLFERCVQQRGGFS